MVKNSTKVDMFGAQVLWLYFAIFSSLVEIRTNIQSQLRTYLHFVGTGCSP